MIFCPCCRHMTTNYKEVTTPQKLTVNGVEFAYLETTALCIECGGEVYVPEINDLNVKVREAAYRMATMEVNNAQS